MAALPRAMQAQLQQLEQHMLQGQISADQAGMVRDYLQPVRIIEVEQRGDDYSLKFQNRQAHTLTLTRKNGKLSNRITQ
ncbi:hypothetical protein CRP01_10460 [Flavilitoribacter nigricans DSM 23189 = NBRC 102662]|uniref:Uncharacterized protein n=1 Tax=Flavilitoribacter nigricans (strain ATCC 23147 / DSM 23189 / NBRC 102662 / NCIMB 1420 / SS-2) TaxID=1122177 RepID=A0A2D0NEA4_FLAN2|nr:hypothetical protein CRP01_10460 [Flavilitoribacter nigricans DSM 23189 = NBRC 102662]